MELGTGVAIAGLAFAIVLGLPAVFSFVRTRNDQSLAQSNQDAIARLETELRRLASSSELARECLEALSTTVLMHRSIVREFESLDNEMQRIADDIFYDQSNRLKKKLLHLDLVQNRSPGALNAAFQLASQAGDVDSIRWLNNAKEYVDADFTDELDRLTEMLESRLRTRNNFFPPPSQG